MRASNNIQSSIEASLKATPSRLLGRRGGLITRDSWHHRSGVGAPRLRAAIAREPLFRSMQSSVGGTWIPTATAQLISRLASLTHSHPQARNPA